MGGHENLGRGSKESYTNLSSGRRGSDRARRNARTRSNSDADSGEWSTDSDTGAHDEAGPAGPPSHGVAAAPALASAPPPPSSAPALDSPSSASPARTSTGHPAISAVESPTLAV